MTNDAEEAMGIAAAGDVQFCQYGAKSICLTKTRTACTRAQAGDENDPESRVLLRLEDVNAVEAWRGSLPGDGYSNVRRVLLHTLTWRT